MLIGNSLPEHIFIRIVVPFFRLVGPLATVATPIIFFLKPRAFERNACLWPLGVWMVCEAVFFVGVYLPLRTYLQRPTTHPKAQSKADREKLVQRILEHIPDPDAYLSRWFMDASPSDIKLENVKEFFAWSLMNKRYEDVSADDDDELQHYASELGDQPDRAFEPGRGKARSLRTTLDPVPMQPRPLLWYLIVFVVESLSSLHLVLHGFRYHRARSLQSLITMPMRLHVLTTRTSASPSISYWYREHKSKTRSPIVFVHGIGIGFYTYVGFMEALASADEDRAADDTVGVIAIELTSITARLCVTAQSAMDVKEEMSSILDSHGWTNVVLVGHSYGTAVASTMLRDPTFAKRINATVLMDPICFMLHLPDVAYNFTRRLPRRANERMLHYFASQDMMISHTLARRFFWSQLILFKEDLPPDIPLTVTLSGKDLIVPTSAVWTYLTGQPVPHILHSESKKVDRHAVVQNGQIRVHWFADFDHAGLFARKGSRRGIAREARKYTEL